MRKPAILGYILLTAHRAQITLAAALLLIALVISPMVDAGLNRMIPPKTSSKLFGLVKEHKQRPLRNRLDRIIMMSFRLISGGAVLYLVWLRIPSGAADAARYARRKETRAQQVESSDPREAINLYRRAMLFTLDPTQERQIANNISRLESTAPSDPTAIISDGETIMETAGGKTGGESGAYRNGNHDPIGQDGRYVLEEELGTGGMGTVYRGLDTILDRRIAVKKLSDQFMGDDEYRSRFRREARALAKLTHPAIVQVYDLIEDRGRYWMVLEYVEGGDLAGYLNDRKRVPLEESIAMIRKIAEGLACAHGQGIIHRDLKPANILLTQNHDPKISDFGLARLACSSVVTQEGAILGSPRYMSPEQAAGDPSDERSDIYALGITFYELLAGRPPFEGDTSRVLAQQITQPPPPLPKIAVDIPKDIERLIMQMLAKDPSDRPANMTAIVNMLDRLIPSAKAGSPQTQ